jgi:hypothetical protein
MCVLMVVDRALAELVVERYGSGEVAFTSLKERLNEFNHDKLLKDVAKNFDAAGKPITTENAVILNIQQEEDLYLRDYFETSLVNSPELVTAAIQETESCLRQFREGPMVFKPSVSVPSIPDDQLLLDDGFGEFMPWADEDAAIRDVNEMVSLHVLLLLCFFVF